MGGELARRIYRFCLSWLVRTRRAGPPAICWQEAAGSYPFASLAATFQRVSLQIHLILYLSPSFPAKISWLTDDRTRTRASSHSDGCPPPSPFVFRARTAGSPRPSGRPSQRRVNGYANVGKSSKH